MTRTTVEIPVSAAPLGDGGGVRPRPDGTDPGALVAWALDLARRWGWVIGGLAVVGAVLAALVSLAEPRVYTARASLLLEPRYPHVLDTPGVRADEVHDELRYIRTQYEVLRSRALAEQVIRDEGLRHERSLGGRPADARTDWATLDGGLIDAYLNGLWIEPIPGTRLIDVTFTSTDAPLAARIANAHATAFVDYGHRQWANANQAGIEFLRARLVELRERLERSEAALNAYRWDTGIIALDDRENVIVEQLDALIKRLTEAEAARLALEADVHALDAHGADALPAIVEHAGLHEIAVHLALAEAEYAKAAARFKPSYPGVAEERRKVEALQRRMARETRRVENALRTAYAAAVEREAQMRTRLEEQKARALRLKDESVHYAILTREVETNRGLYDGVLRRMKEMAVASDLRASNVSVVDRATVPTSPSGPARLHPIALAAVGGLLLGIALMAGCEMLDPRVRSPEHAGRCTRLPVLGTVPQVAPNGAPLPTPRGAWDLARRAWPAPRLLPAESLLLPGPTDAVLADAYRTIRTAVLLARPAAAPRTILVTSGMDGEGRTTTAINLAAALAQTEASVLVVDADLRDPCCDRLLGLPDSLGLSDVLTGRAELEAAVQQVRGRRLSLLPAGSPVDNPTELLGSPEMQTLLGQAAEHFDWIVLDSPGVGAAPDALVLSTMVDGVVLVARDRWTPRPTLATTRARFAYARAPMLGVVLNGTEVADDPYAPLQAIIRPRPSSTPTRASERRRVA